MSRFDEDDHEDTTAGQDRHIRPQGGTSRDVEDEVDPASVGVLLHEGHEVVVAVQRRMGTEGDTVHGPLRGPGRRQHLHPTSVG